MSSDLVYHYTSQRGLLGIVDSAKIWASGIGFLNDSEEFQYTVNLVKEVKKFKSGELNALIANDKITDEFWGHIDRMLEYLSDKKLSYVCSFSEEPDLLSQWRAYCPSNSGYSLGFSRKDLIELAKKQDFRLEQCVYDRAVQLEKLTILFEKYLGELSGRDELEESLNIAAKFGRDMIELAPLFKNPSFKEEKEWRLVSSLIVDTEVKFREGISTIVPFIEFDLACNDVLCLKELVIGPTPHPDLSESSIKKLMVEKLDSMLNIVKSDIPYRTW